jgi:hypothetical protein
MSAITFERIPAEVDGPTLVSEKASETRCRGREFRDSLERYIAGYIAYQIDPTKVIGSGVNSKEPTWLRPLRRLLTATGEIWLFSREICGDWRHPYRGQES